MKIKNQNEYQMENQIENKIENDRVREFENKNEIKIENDHTGECKNKNEFKIENKRMGEYENKMENKDERNLNLDCPASSLGNRDVRNKSDATLDERNLRGEYKIKNENDDERNLKNKNENKNENKNKTGVDDNMKKIEKIICDYRPLILASISRYCNLPGFFDDLYQDGVVEVIEAMKEYDPAKGTVGGYLKTRLKLFYINKYKRLIRRETDDIDNIKAKDQPSVMAIAAHENKMLVARLLSTLDPDERTVIELTFLMEMRASEVSKIMGISKRKVYYLKETGMRKLQKMSTRENLSMRDVVNDEDVYKGGGKKTYKNVE